MGTPLSLTPPVDDAFALSTTRGVPEVAMKKNRQKRMKFVWAQAKLWGQPPRIPEDRREQNAKRAIAVPLHQGIGWCDQPVCVRARSAISVQVKPPLDIPPLGSH